MAVTQPTAAEWSEAAWEIQGWIKSCYDVVGVCCICGCHEHVPNCPWPKMRRLLDRSNLPSQSSGDTLKVDVIIRPTEGKS